VSAAPGSAVIWLVTNTATLYSAHTAGYKRSVSDGRDKTLQCQHPCHKKQGVVKPEIPDVPGPTITVQYNTMYPSGKGSGLLWTHTLRPFYSRPIVLTQEGRNLVNDVCECVRD